MSLVDSTSEVALPPTGRWGTVRATLAGWHPHKVGLRTRIFFMFGMGALLLAGFLAAAAYSFTRSSVITQRETAGIATAIGEEVRKGGIVLDQQQLAIHHLGRSPPCPARRFIRPG